MRRTHWSSRRVFDCSNSAGVIAPESLSFFSFSSSMATLMADDSFFDPLSHSVAGWRRNVYITSGAGSARQSNPPDRFLPVFPVFRVLPEHAQSQALLKCAVIDQVHHLTRFRVWGEVEFHNEVPKSSLAKLQASIVVAAVA